MLGLSALVLIQFAVVSPSVQQAEVLSSTNERQQLDNIDITRSHGHGGYSDRLLFAGARKWLAALRNSTRSPDGWVDAEAHSKLAKAKQTLDPALSPAAWGTRRRLSGAQSGHGSKHMPHKQVRILID
jgi:hypothetical protein